MTFTVVLLFVVIFIVLGTLALGGYLAAPWVPLWKPDIRRMLTLAELKPGEALYDLGAGDGRMLIMGAREFGSRGVGYEIAVLPYLIGRVIIWARGLSGKVRLRYKNFYTAELGNADVVTLFLMPKATAKLKPKFERELKPGCRVVSYSFQIPGWQPTKVDKPNQQLASVYLYVR